MGEHRLAGWIIVAISVITAIVVVSMRFAALEEAKQTHTKEIAKLIEANEAIAERLRAIESNNELKVRVNVIAEDVSFIRGQMQELKADVRHRER